MEPTNEQVASAEVATACEEKDYSKIEKWIRAKQPFDGSGLELDHWNVLLTEAELLS